MLANVSERGEFAATDAYIMSRMRNESVTKKLTGAGHRHRGPGRAEGQGLDGERLRVVDVRRTADQDRRRHARLGQHRGRPQGADHDGDAVPPQDLRRRLSPRKCRSQSRASHVGRRRRRGREAQGPAATAPQARQDAHHPADGGGRVRRGGARQRSSPTTAAGSPLEELRHECGVSRDGSKASNVLRAARKYGLDAKGYKYEDAREALRRCPSRSSCSGTSTTSSCSKGSGKGKVYLNDPAQGPRVISMAGARRLLLGRRADLQARAPEFKKGGAAAEHAAGAAPAPGRLGGRAALRDALRPAAGRPRPGHPDLHARSSSTTTWSAARSGSSGRCCWFMAGDASSSRAILTWLQRYYLLRLETKLALGTSSRFFNHILRLPAAYFGQRFAGEIGSRVADQRQRRQGRRAASWRRRPSTAS